MTETGKYSQSRLEPKAARIQKLNAKFSEITEMQVTKISFKFHGMKAAASTENGKIAWIMLDGQVGPAEQWSEELQQAARKALNLI